MYTKSQYEIFIISKAISTFLKNTKWATDGQRCVYGHMFIENLSLFWLMKPRLNVWHEIF